MNYSIIKSILKGVKYTIIIILGLIIAGLPVKYPEIAGFVIGDTTIGALLVIAYDYIKHKWNVNLP